MSGSDIEKLKAFMEADPEGARKLLRKLETKVLKPHPGQQEVLRAQERFLVLNAGRRWGKTLVGVKRCLRECRKEDQLVWWVAPTYKVVKRGYAAFLKQCPRDLLTHDPPPESTFDAGRSAILRFKSGSRLEFYSAERPGGMLGEGVNFVVLDEAATMPAGVWQQVVRPTLADYQGGALFISTPRGRNWFYQRWLMGQDADKPDWKSWTFPSESNPYLHPDEIQAMKDELPSLEFEQEVLASFIAAGSSVFRFGNRSVQFNKVLENGFVEDVKIRGQVYLGIDLAKSRDFTVLYGALEHNRRNCYFDRFNSVKWPEQRRMIRRAVKDLMRAGAESVTLIMDSTGVGDPVVEELEDEGYDVIGLNFTSVKDKMVRLLAKDLEDAKAFILEDAHRVEFDNYAMTLSPNGRTTTYSAPEGQHDDVVSAKMLSHWGMIHEGAPNIETLSGSDLDPDDSDPGVPDGMIDDEAWDDLLDDYEEGVTGVPRDSGVPTRRLLRPPTPEELLNNPEVWL